jgi:hypothetical protein
MALPVEFLIEALEELEDLSAIARQLTVLADTGRIACGQADPDLFELSIGEKRVFYRFEDGQILVLWAESISPTRH